MSGGVSTPGVVGFDYTAWALAYPQFSTTVLTAQQAQTYFNIAQNYCDNTATALIGDSSVGGQRETALYLLTAHVAQLFVGSNGAPATGAVGRVSGGSEGSVSVSLEMPAPTSPLQGWLQQTQYGAMYWAVTAQFRTARYIPAPGRWGQPLTVVGQPGLQPPAGIYGGGF